MHSLLIVMSDRSSHCMIVGQALDWLICHTTVALLLDRRDQARVSHSCTHA